MLLHRQRLEHRKNAAIRSDEGSRVLDGLEDVSIAEPEVAALKLNSKACRERAAEAAMVAPKVALPYAPMEQQRQDSHRALSEPMFIALDEMKVSSKPCTNTAKTGALSSDPLTVRMSELLNRFSYGSAAPDGMEAMQLQIMSQTLTSIIQEEEKKALLLQLQAAIAMRSATAPVPLGGFNFLQQQLLPPSPHLCFSQPVTAPADSSLATILLRSSLDTLSAALQAPAPPGLEHPVQTADFRLQRRSL